MHLKKKILWRLLTRLSDYSASGAHLGHEVKYLTYFGIKSMNDIPYCN